MRFEMYHKTKFRAARTPQVSIQKTGRIGLNGGCLEEFLPGASHVHLYFDAKEKLVGLKPLAGKAEDADAYSLIKTKRAKSRFIQAVGFFKHHGILPGETLRFEPRWDEKSGLLVVDLKKPLA